MLCPLHGRTPRQTRDPGKAPAHNAHARRASRRPPNGPRLAFEAKEMAMVALHREIPVLTLPDSTGRQISTWDYKQDRPVVLAFAGGDSTLAAKLADRYDEYRKANAEVLLIAPERPEANPPFPVLL